MIAGYSDLHPNARRLEGRVAMVTGAANGIGQGIAELFAAHGAKVIAIDVDAERGQSVVAEIEAFGGTAHFVQVDVSEPEAIDAVVRQSVSRWGAIDVLVNNAGIMPEGTAVSTSDATWNRVMEINLASMFRFARAVVPRMSERGGSIVNIASVQGLRGHPNRAAYVTSKHGVIGLTKALAADHAAAGIRANAICPGTIDTPMLHRELEKVAESDREATIAGYRALHPLGMIGEPVDVAYAALFLAGDESRFITGTSIVVDGGYTSLIVHE
ncbi:MAG: SDR family NAD(P)-dependent oxidoreductase [Thermomicrobiales bacterium]